jgi:MFS family permease
LSQKYTHGVDEYCLQICQLLPTCQQIINVTFLSRLHAFPKTCEWVTPDSLQTACLRLWRICTPSSDRTHEFLAQEFATSFDIAHLHPVSGTIPSGPSFALLNGMNNAEGVGVNMMRRKPEHDVVPHESGDPESRGWRLIQTRDFGLLWWGQVTSQIGEGLNKVALLWFVYELTGSALMIATVGLIQTVPPLIFGPLIGVYLDRLRKKPIMVWVDLIRTGLTVLIPALYGLGLLRLEGLFILIFLTSMVSTVFGPALVSAVPLLVRRGELVSANALIQSTNNIGTLLGPAVSGILIALIGAQYVLYVNAATFLISALCLMPIRCQETVPERQQQNADSATSVFRDLLVGFRFVFGDRSTVLLLVTITALYNLGASAFVFVLPVYAKELLHMGPIQLGWLWSALGVGMLTASSWLALRQSTDAQSRMKILVSGTTMGGLATCTLGLLESPLLAAGLVILVGAGAALLNPVVFALLQELTPSHLMGRVLTTFSTGSMAAAMVGMSGFGWIADKIGPAESLVGLGLVLLLTASVAMLFSRKAIDTSMAATA